MKVGDYSTCRFCKNAKETIDHLVAGCSMLAIKEYLERHNKVAKYVHWKLCRHYNLKTSDHWYEHEVLAVVENENVTIMWDFTIHTYRTIKANRPDIVVREKKMLHARRINTVRQENVNENF